MSSPRRELHGIDVLEPIELIPVGLSLHGTLQIYRLKDDGGAEAAGLLPTWQRFTMGKYFSIHVIDRTTDGLLMQADNCEVISQSWSISPKAFVLGTVSFSGFGYSNNAE
jgi:hypothetical protein